MESEGEIPETVTEIKNRVVGIICMSLYINHFNKAFMVSEI